LQREPLVKRKVVRYMCWYAKKEKRNGRPASTTDEYTDPDGCERVATSASQSNLCGNRRGSPPTNDVSGSTTHANRSIGKFKPGVGKRIRG
jgi:hypothetical protein